MQTFDNLKPGSNDLGEIAINKFILFVGFNDAENGGATRTILRGGSPSTRMQGHDAAFSSPLAALDPRMASRLDTTGSRGESATSRIGENAVLDRKHDEGHPDNDVAWPHPPMHPEIAMSPGMATVSPTVNPYTLSPANLDLSEVPLARPRETVQLADGDTLDLTAGLVRRSIQGRDLLMLGYNGQYPGPLIRANEKATIVVRFHNAVDYPTAVHWHGIRIENAFDGVPGITQDPVPSGGTFVYRVRLPDPGLYWYHPHHREDIFQELGLYGNLLVDPIDDGYYNNVSMEEVLVLDDLLLDRNNVVPFGRESANYMFMGRFGNVYLLNGAPDYSLDVSRGDVVRFFMTNVSNTRTFNLRIGGAKLKVVASDISRFEREEWVDSIVMAPAERYILEARFDTLGVFQLTNRVQAVNHTSGSYFAEVDTLGTVTVREAAHDHSTHAFDSLRVHHEVVRDIDKYRQYFEQVPDRELVLTLATTDLPPIVEQTMSLESAYFNPVEWSGTMPMMNWASSGNEVAWILRDPVSGAENMDIDWDFTVGDVIKIRVTNDRDAFHAMQHPLHIHGQRFLVIAQNGSPESNLAWKDTVLLPSGSTTDLLLDVTNPGRWMVHCHIAEHLESGMKMIFDVQE
ncbi:MAG: multicopper oxidase family protein [Rhodothermales bacterium]|nr:multicopper oxidase family protein [Rhodothermales bacterium]